MAMLSAILVLMLASGLMAGMFAAVLADQRSHQTDRDQTHAYAAAHAGLEKLTSTRSTTTPRRSRASSTHRPAGRRGLATPSRSRPTPGRGRTRATRCPPRAASLLNLGFAGPNLQGNQCADPMPNAVIRLQRLRDSGLGAGGGTGTASTNYANSTDGRDDYPNMLFDAREGNSRLLATSAD